jgi:steroid delta-isomerase-like uncharacterized protein
MMPTFLGLLALSRGRFAEEGVRRTGRSTNSFSRTLVVFTQRRSRCILGSSSIFHRWFIAVDYSILCGMREPAREGEQMEATDVAKRYFDAWNQRDPEAIVATFADGGTYSDPNVPEGLSGQAIAHYAGGLFAAFPDLSFDLLSHGSISDGVVAAQWVMRGTNTGPLRGNPPTGDSVALPGADFIAVEGDKVHSVQGYFDRSALAEQLGLQVIMQLHRLGPSPSVPASASTRESAPSPVPSASSGYRSAPRKRRSRFETVAVPPRRRWSICPAS